MIRKDNLKVYYKLNGSKSSDGKILDFSGNGNHGTLTGTEVYTTNTLGKKVFDFDGSSYIFAENTETLAQTNTHTYVMRVKLETASTETLVTIFSKGGGASTSSCIDINNTQLRFLGYDSTGTLCIIYNNYVRNGYNNKEVVLTLVQDTNLIKAYINKELVGTSTTKGNNWLTNSTRISVGSRNTGIISDIPTGDFLFFDNVALTQTEIEQLVDELNSPPEFSPKMTPSLTSDGIDDYIDTGLVNGNMSKIELYYIPVATGTNQILADGTISTTSLFTQSSGTINTVFRVSGDRRTPLGSLTFGVATKIVADYNAEKIYINDIEQSLIAGTGALSSTGNVLLMKRATGISTNATWFYIKLWDKLGVLVRHFIPQSDGTMLDIVNNVVYSNSGTGTLIYKQEPLVIEDGLVFYTRDGIRDLTGKSTITNNGAIVGKGIKTSEGKYIYTNDIPLTGDYTIETVLESDVQYSGISYWEFGNKNLIQEGFVFYHSGNFGYRETNGSILQTSKINLNTFYNTKNHLVITCINNVLYCYLNGVLKATLEGFDSTDLTFNGVGKGYSTNTVGVNEDFPGKFHMFKIYNRIKSVDEIKSAYEEEIRYW